MKYELCRREGVKAEILKSEMARLLLLEG
jgi:hypothetical protein